MRSTNVIICSHRSSLSVCDGTSEKSRRITRTRLLPTVQPGDVKAAALRPCRPTSRHVPHLNVELDSFPFTPASEVKREIIQTGRIHFIYGNALLESVAA